MKIQMGWTVERQNERKRRMNDSNIEAFLREMSLKDERWVRLIFSRDVGSLDF